MSKALPAGWSTNRLFALAAKIQDGTHFSPQSTGGPYRYVTSKNIRFGQMDLKDCGWISEREHLSIYQRCDVQKGDVLLTKDGANTGNAAINELDEPFSLLSSVAFIRCDESKLLSRYVLQYLLSPNGQRELTDQMAGVAIRRLTLAKIKNLEIDHPNTDEQERICTVLDSADYAIAKTETLIAKLRAVKQGLLHDLLTRGLDDNGELRDPGKNPEQFKETSLGKCPKRWTLQRLGQMCDLLNGLPFKPTDWTTMGLPIIRIQNLNRGEEFNFYDGVVADKYYIEPGTLLFSWSGNRGTSFGPFIWPGPRGVLNQHIFKVTPKDGVRKRWFYYSLDDVRQRVERVAHGGSGLVHIRRSDLCDYLIATPEPDEQERVETAIAAHDRLIDAEETYLYKLMAIKKGLTQDLLTGRVRVKIEQEIEEK